MVFTRIFCFGWKNRKWCAYVVLDFMKTIILISSCDLGHYLHFQISKFLRRLLPRQLVWFMCTPIMHCRLHAKSWLIRIWKFSFRWGALCIFPCTISYFVFKKIFSCKRLEFMCDAHVVLQLVSGLWVASYIGSLCNFLTLVYLGEFFTALSFFLISP
jgi:hypothetical protein